MPARADPPGASLPTSERHLARHAPQLHALSPQRYFQFPGCVMLFLASSQHLLCPVLFIRLFPSWTNSTDPSGLHLEPLSPGSLPGYPPTVSSTGRSAPAASLPTALLVGGWVGCGWCTPWSPTPSASTWPGVGSQPVCTEWRNDSPVSCQSLSSGVSTFLPPSIFTHFFISASSHPPPEEL